MASENDETYERSVKQYIEICERCFRTCLKPRGTMRLSPGEVNCMEACIRRELRRNKQRAEITSQQNN